MTGSATKGDRIAKVMARAGLCSRRDAERWIAEGRVVVNGEKLTSPAFNVTPDDAVLVDGAPLPDKERTRLWLYHKPKGLVTSTHDGEGRPTVFAALPKTLPRVISIGRLDINTEGLLLLTNDGALARHLELPSTGWLRRYRVRAFGKIDQETLDSLTDGIAIDGVLYGAVEANLERQQGGNAWLTIGLREGKNREVKRILEHLGLAVNRLIRMSYGPFQLGDVGEGEVQEVRGRVLRDQLGPALVQELGLLFNSGADLDTTTAPKRKKGGQVAVQVKKQRRIKPGATPRDKGKPRGLDALDRVTTKGKAGGKTGAKTGQRRVRKDHADRRR